MVLDSWRCSNDVIVATFVGDAAGVDVPSIDGGTLIQSVSVERVLDTTRVRMV